MSCQENFPPYLSGCLLPLAHSGSQHAHPSPSCCPQHSFPPPLLTVSASPGLGMECYQVANDRIFGSATGVPQTTVPREGGPQEPPRLLLSSATRKCGTSERGKLFAFRQWPDSHDLHVRIKSERERTSMMHALAHD